MKGGIFVGPQIRRMLASEEPKKQISELERNAWQAFRTGVCKLRPAGQMRPASENCAARGELRFLNRVRPANVSHVFWRCLIKSMSEINLE